MNADGKTQYVHKPQEPTAHECAGMRPTIARRLPRMTESEAGIELAHALQLIDQMRKEAERAGVWEKSALIERERKAQQQISYMRGTISDYASRLRATRNANPRRVPSWILEELAEVLIAAELEDAP